MKICKKLIIFLTIVFFITQFFIVKPVSANVLEENIFEQIEALDLSELEKFYEDLLLDDSIKNTSIKEKILTLLSGKYDSSSELIYNIIISNTTNTIKNYLPLILSIIALALLCSTINNVKSNLLGENVSSIVNFVCSITIIVLLANEIIGLYIESKNIIENIAKLNEIMSPIILTLMVATGSNVSASVYTPQTMLLSTIILNVFLKIILPLVICLTILNVVNEISSGVKLNSFIEFISGTIKWIIGIALTIFAIFITTQGLTSASFDGVSIKALKYAISNSIPIVGGFLKDGFDIVLAGSVLIKNALGVVSVFIMLGFIISPVIKIIIFSLLLKFATAIIEIFSPNNYVNYIKTTSKSLTYFNICSLSCSFMFFLNVLLIILTANSFL